MKMENQFKIPIGDEKITLELTVKEALALAGTRFLEPNVVIDARKKVKETLEAMAPVLDGACKRRPVWDPRHE